MHPILFRLGSFRVYSYGASLAIAFLVSIYLARREAARREINPDIIWDFSFYVIIFSLLGSRFLSILLDWDYYRDNLAVLFTLRQSGFAFYGGFIAGVLTTVWFCRRRRISFWGFADVLTPSLVLGQAIGRIGCFLNGCCYGVATDLPWAVVFNHPDSSALLHTPLHPTQLYESGLDLFIFSLIWRLSHRTRYYDGKIFLLYLILYSAGRIVIETFRADSVFIGGIPLRGAQVAGIVSIVTALILMPRLRRREMPLTSILSPEGRGR